MVDQIVSVPAHHSVVVTDSREAAAPNWYNLLIRRSEEDWELVRARIPGGTGFRWEADPKVSAYEIGTEGFYLRGFAVHRMALSRVTNPHPLMSRIEYDDTGGDRDFNDLVVKFTLTNHPAFPG